MSNKDFQNGFALGLASGGVVEVEIPAKEEQEKTITITENGTTEILPDENKALSKVTVVTDVSSGGASLNIAYGETPPEDTSKLWIKANEPNNIKIGSGTLSYIESTGTQYIDTGYIANQNTKIKCKYQIVGKNTNYDNLFGDFTNIQYSHRYEDNYKNLQLIKWGGQYTTYGSALSSSDVTTLEVNNGTFTFIENGVRTTKTVNENAEFISQYSLLLFCNRYYANISIYDSSTLSKARIYYFQIYEGETLVRDFVPAVDENGVVCLYDNVTKAYFYNQGSGKFGRDIIPSELTQGNIEIQTDLFKNKFNLINTENNKVEIGVENVYIGNANNEAELCEAYLHNGTEWVVIE